MYADDDDEVYPDPQQHVLNERLERVGGVLVEPEHTQVDCNEPDGGCAPDDYPEDPSSIDNRPGTPDDLGYDFGVEEREPTDIHLVPEGATSPLRRSGPTTERDLEPGTLDEQDLWKHQEPLIETDVDDGVKIPVGMDDEDGRRIMGAMGDDSGDAAQEDILSPSATGEPTSQPDNGGFPDSDE